MNIKEYINLLNSHDWYYQYSDDIRIYHKGCEELTNLKTLYRKYPYLKSIYKTWEEYIRGIIDKPLTSDFIGIIPIY